MNRSTQDSGRNVGEVHHPFNALHMPSLALGDSNSSGARTSLTRRESGANGEETRVLGTTDELMRVAAELRFNACITSAHHRQTRTNRYSENNRHRRTSPKPKGQRTFSGVRRKSTRFQGGIDLSKSAPNGHC